MCRRFWPAVGLIAALILAASPLLAAQTSQQVVTPGTRTAEPCVARPSLTPGHPSAPAGDDDMPDRSGGGARTVDDPNLGPNKAAVGVGWGFWAQASGWRQHWVLYLRLLVGR